MHTFDFIGFFTTIMQLTPGAPFIHRYEINELTGKCRTSIATFVRVWPFWIAVVFGRWRKSDLTEAEMFRKVFRTRNIDLYDEDGNLDERFQNDVRQVVADHTNSPDEEWTILQMLELDQ